MQAEKVHPVERALLSGIPAGEPLILCVSGGKDSSAMLAGVSKISQSLDSTPEVIHFDHGLRANSQGEASFVREAAERSGFGFVSFSLEVKERASSGGLSIEEAARILRYEKLDEYTSLKPRTGTVLTAHTADDQAETLILRLITGSGRTGMQGIREEFKLPGGWKVRRPFLEVSAAEVLDYLACSGAGYLEDTSNCDTVFRRNFVRHRIIPLMKEINPSLVKSVSRQADILAGEEKFIAGEAAREIEKIRVERKEGRIIIEITDFMSYNIWLRRRILRALSPVEPDYSRVEALEGLLCKTGGSRCVELGGGWHARKEYSLLIFEQAKPFSGEFCVKLAEGVNRLPGPGCCTVTLGFRKGWDITLPPPEGVEYFDAAAAGFPLWARSRRDGDRISPWGMKGHKKVKDILIDLKAPLEGRAGVVIVENEKNIIWAAPYRRSSSAPVGEKTQKVLEVKIENKNIGITA